MKTPPKVAGFAVGLAVLFAAAFAIGSIVGPFGSDDESDTHGEKSKKPAADELQGGLVISEAGYTLRPEQTPSQPGIETELRFSIAGPDDEPVTKFTETHEKDLHLIVVRSDLAHYQHVHPAIDDSGTWTLPITVAAAGQYRMFADFQPADHDTALTLGADFIVTGSYVPTPLPEPIEKATVDGYDVSISGELVAGETSKVALEVTKDGQAVTDLEPYLGAYGHLVALRDGDLAYLHVHPDGEPGDGKTDAGPKVVFYAEVPSADSYRLYLDFKHGGVVRTAEFTVTANDKGAEKPTSPTEEHDHGGHG